MMDIYRFLDTLGIGYERCDHPAVFTVEEARRFVPKLPGAETKNLFIHDDKKRKHFLVIVGYDKSVDLKKLAGVLGVKRVRFASPARLKTFLGVEPGSVSFLALVNDRERKVELVFDRELWGHEAFLAHPLVNTSTLVIGKDDVNRFFKETGYQVRIIDVPER